MRLISIIRKNINYPIKGMITHPITGKIIPNSTMETLKQINHNYFNNLVEIEKDDKTNEIQKNKCILKKKDLKKTSTIN
jgi:hypothetical protein